MSDERIAELAALDTIPYDQQREAAAEALGVRVTILDQEVRRARKANRGNSLVFPETEMWPEEVDGDDLLDGITRATRRYLALPEGGAELLALWAVHTHCFRQFPHSPRLCITAPEKGCGKTRVLDILERLVAKQCRADNLTAAVLFRVVDAYGPSLLIDETDRFLAEKEELIGIVNSGHRNGGQSWRCEGDNNELKSFSTFAPTALAGIGKMPSTIMDRAVMLEMRRRRQDEEISRFRADRAEDLDDLAKQVAKWVSDNELMLSGADPDMPAGLPDRACDNWRPLLAIADVAGGEWPERARALALRLSDASFDDDTSTRIMLLADLRGLFEDRSADHITTKDILEHLHGLVERPWVEWRQGKELTARQLAALLGPLRIRSADVKTPGTNQVAKAYRKADFTDAWERYLPQSATALRPAENCEKHAISFRYPNLSVADEKPLNPAENRQSSGVADISPSSRANGHGEPRSRDIGKAEERVAVQQFDG